MLCLFLLPIISAGQEDVWDVYMAQYDKGAGTTLINMSLKGSAPKSEFPFIVITGVTYSRCDPKGFPFKDEFPVLYRISDSVKMTIERYTTCIQTGTFTYQCDRLDYLYVNDTSGLRKALWEMYSASFDGYTPYINMREDKKWEGYLSFLYPNEEAQEYMKNQKVILKLQDAGDKLDKPRRVDHWAYFQTVGDRDCFVKYVEERNYKIERKEKTEIADMPYKVQIFRPDKVDNGSISRVTLELRRAADKCKGRYDGWETIVVR